MSDRHDRATDFAGLGFWLFVLVCVVLFAGSPDLHDVLVEYFRGRCG